MVFPDSKITLELGQEYAIDSISIQIGDSQRPGQMGIFKSLTFENYKQWMFLVTTQNECSKFDGVQFNLDVDSLNSVTCTTYGTRAQSGNETVS
ncbi:laminin subunit alpha lam-3-like [Saccoglossus kowalevskii]